MDNKRINDDLNSRIIELAGLENKIEELDDKIRIVLDKRDDTNEGYDALLDDKESIKRSVAIRNRKYMVLGTFFAVCAMDIIAFLTTGLASALLNLPLNIKNIVTVVSMLFVTLYEGILFVKSYNDEKQIYAQLDENEEYQNVLKQIRDVEREMKYLDMEYENLANERDDIEFDIESLRIKISSSTGIVDLESMIEKAKINLRNVSGTLENDDSSIVQESRNSQLVRRRGIGHRR